MRLVDYIKYILAQITCQLALILIIDAVLLTSSSLGKSLQDILYLNILLSLVLAGFITFSFIRMKSRYAMLSKALEENRSIDYRLPEDDSFYSTILRSAVQQKNTENLELIGTYRNNIDELNNYITKWVHEIKIPISVSELMLENTDTLGIETTRKYKTELERIKFLVNQVLYAGRAAQYQEDLNTTHFNLQNAVKDALKLNAYFLMSKNIEVNTGKLDYSIINDEKWIIYILEQILNNASKYVRQDGKVEIYAEEDDKTIKLYIRDNGIGIPSTDIARIFDKGFTGENGRKTSKSTGMGLYYSKKMADLLGVGLEVDSKAGEFTEFVIVFYKVSDYLNVTKL